MAPLIKLIVVLAILLLPAVLGLTLAIWQLRRSMPRRQRYPHWAKVDKPDADFDQRFGSFPFRTK